MVARRRRAAAASRGRIVGGDDRFAARRGFSVEEPAMPDLVIRDARIVDGTGRRSRPGGPRRRRWPDHRSRPRRGPRHPGDRRRRAGARAGLHRPPHPLRLPAVLGPAGDAVAVARGHDGRDGQLRLHHRAVPAVRPRDAHAAAALRRGHADRDAARRHRVVVGGLSGVPRRHRSAAPGGERRLVHRAFRRAPARHGRGGERARRHRRGARADGGAGPPGSRRRRARLVDVALADAFLRRHQSAGAEPSRRRGRAPHPGRGAARSRPRRDRGRPAEHHRPAGRQGGGAALPGDAGAGERQGRLVGAAARQSLRAGKCAAHPGRGGGPAGRRRAGRAPGRLPSARAALRLRAAGVRPREQRLLAADHGRAARAAEGTLRRSHVPCRAGHVRGRLRRGAGAGVAQPLRPLPGDAEPARPGATAAWRRWRPSAARRRSTPSATW